MDRNRDFRAWKVPELKTFLKDRGINVSGRKEELIARAKGCEALDISVNIHDDDSENSGLMLRQYELLTTPNGYKLPDPTKLDGWKDVLECPDVTDRHITEYLVHSRHRTEDKRQMGATRQLKASSLFKEGHVFSPNYHPIAEDCSHCFVSARVLPSLPGRDQRTTPHHFTWICLSKSDGVIHSADCSCTAGEGGSCNHIAAVLYMLADLTERRQQGLLSCTSQTCSWLQPRQRNLSPKKVTERPLRPSVPKNTGFVPGKVVMNFSRLRDKLVKCAPECGYVSVTADPAEQPEAVQFGLPQPSFLYCDWVDLRSKPCRLTFEHYVQSLSLTEKDREEMERGTRGQAKNFRWCQARLGRLTSSRFGAVMCRQEKTAPDSLVGEVMGYGFFDSVFTKWGRDHEAAARRQYFNRMTKCHHPLTTVSECGLLVDTAHPYLSTSPDGLVSCPHCSPSRGVLEIKCPYTHRNETVEEACKDNTFCCRLVDGKVMLKRNHKYFSQVQGQMAITGRQWCDFVVWTMKEMTVERIVFDKEMWESSISKLGAFFLKGVVPEIFSRRVQRKLRLYQ